MMNANLANGSMSKLIPLPPAINTYPYLGYFYKDSDNCAKFNFAFNEAKREKSISDINTVIYSGSYWYTSEGKDVMRYYAVATFASNSEKSIDNVGYIYDETYCNKDITSYYQLRALAESTLREKATITEEYSFESFIQYPLVGMNYDVFIAPTSESMELIQAEYDFNSNNAKYIFSFSRTPQINSYVFNRGTA